MLSALSGFSLAYAAILGMLLMIMASVLIHTVRRLYDDIRSPDTVEVNDKFIKKGGKDDFGKDRALNRVKTDGRENNDDEEDFDAEEVEVADWFKGE